MIGAHRLALAIETGGDCPEKFACHTCDNPICCNPAHLFWGSPKDNTQDCIAKGRFGGAVRKFDREEMRTLRLAGWSYSALAEKFGVNQASIGRALKKMGLGGAIRPNQNGAACLRALLEQEREQ